MPHPYLRTPQVAQSARTIVSVDLFYHERKGVRSREDTLFITIVNEEKAMSLLETQYEWLKTKLEGLEDEA